MSTKNWNAQIQFPTDSDYVNRITDVKFGPSNSSGNPMVTLECEVVSPTSKEVGTDTVVISGVSTKNYFTTEVIGDAEKTESQRERFVNLMSSLGQDVSNLNWDNLGPQIQPLKGLLILTMMEAEVEERTKNPTAAEIEKGKAEGLNVKQIKGQVLKNPLTGKPLINYWPKIREIFGLAPNQTTVAGKNPY